jgi:translation initiation factor 3 subunit A
LGQGLLKDVSEVAVKIHGLTENEFCPLVLKKKIGPLLASLESSGEATAKYVQPLNKLSTLRVLQQLSTVYKSMKFDNLLRILPDCSWRDIELITMDAVRFGHLFIRIDHRARIVIFQDEDMESDRMRNQLNLLAIKLQKVVERIEPVSAEDKALERRRVFDTVERGIEDERVDVFKRQEEIEKRKQAHEARDLERQKQQESARAAAKKRVLEDEKARLAEEKKIREAEKVETDKAEAEQQAKKKIAQQIQKNLDAEPALKGKAAKKIKAVTQRVEDFDKSAILAAQAEWESQKKLQAENKVKELIKRLDYLTRAMRLDEKELLIKAQETQRIAERDAFEADFKKFEGSHLTNHAKALEEKHRLVRMAVHKDTFFARVMKVRTSAWEEEVAQEKDRREKQRAERERTKVLQRQQESERKVEEEKKKKN